MTGRFDRLRHSRGGFTLLEVILSLTLLAIITVEIGGAFWGGVRASEKGRARSEALERYRTVHGLVRDQLGSALLLPVEDEDGMTRIDFIGEEEALAFRSPISLWGPRDGVVHVEYGRADDDGGDLAFVSTEFDGRGQTLGGSATVLMEGLTDIRFRYRKRPTAVDAGEEWVETWEDTTKLPQAVEIILQAGDQETRWIVPIGVGVIGR